MAGAVDLIDDEDEEEEIVRTIFINANEIGGIRFIPSKHIAKLLNLSMKIDKTESLDLSSYMTTKSEIYAL